MIVQDRTRLTDYLGDHFKIMTEYEEENYYMAALLVAAEEDTWR